MSSAVREGILRTILAQQVVLEVAIERGNVGLQFLIAAAHGGTRKGDCGGGP